MEKLILQVNSVYKSFGITQALADVSLSLYGGCIHGLAGENGSGKSTLSSIIAGAQKADGGLMTLFGEPFAPNNMPSATNSGISIIIQEQGTFPSVTVAANIFAGRENLFIKNGLLDVSKMNAEARKALDLIGATNIKESVILGTLSFEQCKLVELARAVYINPKILIVDETSAVLSKEGRDVLYSNMKKTRDAGNSVLFITHDIDELMEYSDKITILRDGRVITTLQKSEFDDDKIKENMIGRKLQGDYYRNDTKSSRENEIALSVKGLYYREIQDISFDLHRGEIVGIGGLSNCGMHDLGKLLVGVLKPDSGNVTTGKSIIVKNPETAIKNKLAYISKDRDQESLMNTMTVRENICLLSMKKLSKFGLVLKRIERRYANEWKQTLDIRMKDTEQFVIYLSGGNKQKIALAKWMAFDPYVYIMDCPTRGIDIGAKAAIMKVILSLKEQGKAILLISEELAELIGLCDRVLIMKSGKISGSFERSTDLSENMLIHYMI
jgi:ribose transport system ATP-binding protein